MGAEDGAELAPWSHPLCSAPRGAETNNLGSFSPGALLSASASLSISLSFQMPLSASRWLFLFPSPLPPQSGTHSSCGCQVGQAHMLLVGQAPPGAGGAGRQLWGLCSEWLLSPVLRTCQIQLTCRDSWLPLQMHPAGDGEMDAFPTQKAFSPGISFS